MSLSDDELKRLREKYGPSYGWTSGAAEDRAEVVAIIEEALSRGAQLDEWAEKDGSSPGYNLQKAKTYGALAAQFKAERDEARGSIKILNDSRKELLKQLDEARAALSALESEAS